MVFFIGAIDHSEQVIGMTLSGVEPEKMDPHPSLLEVMDGSTSTAASLHLHTPLREKQ